MPKIKKKLTPSQKKARKEAKIERQKKYMWIFIKGKQVRVKRPVTIEGIEGVPEDEWIERNADPIWLHQNGMWDVLEAREDEGDVENEQSLCDFNFSRKL